MITLQMFAFISLFWCQEYSNSKLEIGSDLNWSGNCRIIFLVVIFSKQPSDLFDSSMLVLIWTILAVERDSRFTIFWWGSKKTVGPSYVQKYTSCRSSLKNTAVKWKWAFPFSWHKPLWEELTHYDFNEGMKTFHFS